MKVSVVDSTFDPVHIIGAVASVCYDGDTSRARNLARAQHCKSSGHLAVLRFAYATFNISGISRACSHQLVRVAHAGILQRSQRYCKETNLTFVDPPYLLGCSIDLRLKWAAHQELAEEIYLQAIDEKMQKGDARYILPQGCTTELNICMNFQGWRDFLKNRTSKSAQWEIREVALDIQQKLHAMAPEIFNSPEIEL